MQLKLSLKPYEIPFVRPIKVGSQSLHLRKGIIAHAKTLDGCAYSGEIAPLPGLSKETLSEAYEQAQHATHFTSMDQLKRWVEDADLYPSVAFGMGCLTHQMDPRIHQGGCNRISVNALIFDLPKLWPRQALQYQQQGYECIKIKVGRYLLKDEAQALRTIRRVLGRGTVIRLDANGAWNLKEALHFSSQVEKFDIEYIEDPCRSFRESLQFLELSTIGVAVDRSVPYERWMPAFPGKTDSIENMIVILKPTQIGSLESICQVVSKVQSAGGKCVFSSSFETGIGLSAIANLARKYQPDVAHGLGTMAYLERDILKPPFRVIRGQV